MAETARRLEAEYGHRFGAFVLVEHPAGLPDEIAGKEPTSRTPVTTWPNGSVTRPSTRVG